MHGIYMRWSRISGASFTNLMSPMNLLFVSVLIVLAELCGVALITGVVFAARRLRPAFARAQHRHPQRQGG
jgi:hypothetical protein